MTGPADLEVTSGRTIEDLTAEQLELAARRLVRAGTELGEVAASVAALAVHPLLATGALVGPAATVTLGAAEAALVEAAAWGAGEAVRLQELGLRTLVVVEARRVAERVVGQAVDAQAALVAVLLVGRLPELAVVGVALTAHGLPVARGLEAQAFAEPGAVEFLAAGLDPLVPALLGGVRLLSAGGLLTEGRGVAVLARTPRVAAPPTTLGGLVASGVDLGVGDDVVVRVTQVRHGSRSAWIVQVPGTQSWPPRGGPNPHDLTSNAALLTQQDSVVAAGVARALDAAREQAGAGSDGPVMLVGHSQGGMVAAALAASPSFRARHHVTHVVAYGSPISQVPVPDDVKVLALQHRQDVVPRLDGTPDPRREGWTTVTRDVDDDPDVDGHLLQAHAITEYAETARAAEESPSGAVRDWLRSAEEFLPGGDGEGEGADGSPDGPGGRAGPTTATVRDYVLRRVPESPPDPGPRQPEVPPGHPVSDPPSSVTPARRVGGTW